MEEQDAGYSVVSIRASDRDEEGTDNSRLTYSIVDISVIPGRGISIDPVRMNPL